MNYSEVESKLLELDKVINTFAEGTRLLKIHERDKEYMCILINNINDSIEDLKSRVEDIKNTAIVNYDGDMSYLDDLLNSRVKSTEDEA